VELLETVVDHPSVSDGDQDGWYIDIHNESSIALVIQTDSLKRKVRAIILCMVGKLWQFEHDHSLTSNLSPPKLWSVDEDHNPKKSAKRRIREGY